MDTPWPVDPAYQATSFDKLVQPGTIECGYSVNNNEAWGKQVRQSFLKYFE